MASAVGPAGPEGLRDLDPDLTAFLRQLRASAGFRGLEVHEGEQLAALFEWAGFGDLFHVPTQSELRELAGGGLPDLEGSLVGRISLDTHLSLLANLGHAARQAGIDEAFREHLPQIAREVT